MKHKSNLLFDNLMNFTLNKLVTTNLIFLKKSIDHDEQLEYESIKIKLIGEFN